MDWILDFQKRFEQYPEIRNLKSTQFHGAVEINFCAGVPQNYNIKQHRRAVEINDNLNNLNRKE